jgi:hypothetical protein
MPDHATEASILVIYVKSKVMDFNSKSHEFYDASTESNICYSVIPARMINMLPWSDQFSRCADSDAVEGPRS